MTYFLQSGSPLSARQTFPTVLFVTIILLVALFLFLFWFLITRYMKYLNSEEYKNITRNRITTNKDIKNFASKYNISDDKIPILADICKVNKLPNILCSVFNPDLIQQAFKNTYYYYKVNNITTEKLNLFFNLQYDLELILARTKVILSTRQIPENSTVFLITSTAELYPLTLDKNKPNYLSLKVPDFMFNSPAKPEVLERLNFIVKLQNSINYYFISRVIRYEDKNQEHFLIASHTDEIKAQSQRHFRREFLDQEISFSSGSKTTDETKKSYKGYLTNISAGGCCIKTKLPIKENQNIVIDLSSIGINEKLSGIIKKTRKLQENDFFALHIQFTNIPQEAQNRIFAFVYKYEM